MTNWQEKLSKAITTPAVQREAAIGRASAALATLIAQRLAANEMTQEQLAAALGITPGAVSRKLKESCDMRLSSVAAILWAVDVPLYREFERLCEEGWTTPVLSRHVLAFPAPSIAVPDTVIVATDDEWGATA